MREVLALFEALTLAVLVNLTVLVVSEVAAMDWRCW